MAFNSIHRPDSYPHTHQLFFSGYQNSLFTQDHKTLWIFWKKLFREKGKTITDNTPEIIRLQHILLTHICWVNKCFVPTTFIYFLLPQAAAGLLSSGLLQDCMWGRRTISSKVRSVVFFTWVCLKLKFLLFNPILPARCKQAHSSEHPQCSREQQAAAHNPQENPKFSYPSPFGAVSVKLTLGHYKMSRRSWSLPCETPGQGG